MYFLKENLSPCLSITNLPGERGREELGETYGIGLETVRGLI